jgi:2,4-dienoyl-CoA reductase-like NADH-dependent reductase (Old Yellow Enzyme family)
MPGLLEPIRVGRLWLKNRIVMLPMGRGSSGFLGEDGTVTDYLITHYERRARGLGLLIVESSLISMGGRYSTYLLGLYDDRFIPGLKKLVEHIHRHNTPVAIQLNHGGGKAISQLCGGRPVAPSQVTLNDMGELPKMLNIEEITDLVKDYARAASRAVEAGFDAIQLHGAHGFLINQFTSCFSNKRKDEYGGTLKNRMRFPLEIVAQIRRSHPDLPILYRLGIDYEVTGEPCLEEGQLIARQLEDAGVSAIDISAGFHGIVLPPADSCVEGYYIPLAEKIRKATTIPIIGTGRITTPEFADNVIRQHRVDLIGIGRAILADPDWPIRAHEKLSIAK